MKTDILHAFKQRLTSNPVYGPFSKSTDPAFVEAAGYAGFDFIILDLEHGPSSTQNLQNLIRGAEVAGVLPIVRVKEAPRTLIGEVLDIGAAGVQVPQISTADDARAAVAAAKFGAGGGRGVCRFVRAARYATTAGSEYLERANEALVILQLEGQQALDNVESILAVSGIDVVFIGPYDLSQSLGYPGEVEHPEVVRAVTSIVQQCRARGVIVGTFVDTPEAAERWLAAGGRYLSYSVDLGIFTEACRSLLGVLHGAGARATGRILHEMSTDAPPN